MSEYVEVIGAKVADLISTSGSAEAALLCLFTALIPLGVGWAYRDRMTTWQAAMTRAAGLLAALVVLAVQALRGGWFVQVDHAVTGWVVAHRTSTLDSAALAVTNAFGPVGTAAVTALVAVVVAVRFRSYPGGFAIIATVGGVAALCTLTKLLVARARPPIAIQETLETDYSFPSGHVTATAALFGVLALLVGLGRSQLVKRLCLAAAAIVVLAVALSRLYLGVHWLTDVAAAALLGSAAATIGAPVVLRMLIGYRAAEPPQLVSATTAHEDAP